MSSVVLTVVANLANGVLNIFRGRPDGPRGHRARVSPSELFNPMCWIMAGAPRTAAVMVRLRL